MSPRPDVSDERKQQITDAALQLFAEKGVKDTRMEDIAEAAKLSIGGLYWYFKSKEELLVASVEELFSCTQAVGDVAEDRSLSARKRLQEMTRLHTESYDTWSKYFLAAMELANMSFENNDMKNAFYRKFSSYMTLVASVIADGIENGELKKMRPEDGAAVFWALHDGLIYAVLSAPDLIDFKNAYKTGADAIIDGMSLITAEASEAFFASLEIPELAEKAGA